MEKAVRALNIFGAVALVVLALYVGWALMGGADEDKTVMAGPVVTSATH